MPPIVHFAAANLLRDKKLTDSEARMLIEEVERPDNGGFDKNLAVLGDLYERAQKPTAPFRTEPAALQRMSAFLVAHNWHASTSTHAGWDTPLGALASFATVPRRSRDLGVTVDVAAFTSPAQLALSDAGIHEAFGTRPLPATQGAVYAVMSASFPGFLDQLSDHGDLRRMSAAMQAAWLNVYARAAELDRDGVKPYGTHLTVNPWGSWGDSVAHQLSSLQTGRAWRSLKADPAVADALKRVFRALDEPTDGFTLGGRALSSW